MAERTTGERRAEFIARARLAVREGISQARFLRQAVSEGFSIRRTTMISDWHGVSGTEKKAGLLRYVRKDYTPTARVIADVPWQLSREFMYKVQVMARIRPTEPVTERFVNIMSDRPLTPREIEGLAWEMIKEQSPKMLSGIERITPWTAVARIAE